MAQHFLLSAKAGSLSLKAIFRMTDDEAHSTFMAVRFADNNGAAFCPRCGCVEVYTYAARRIWEYKACGHQFSVTSGTILLAANWRSGTICRIASGKMLLSELCCLTQSVTEECARGTMPS